MRWLDSNLFANEDTDRLLAVSDYHLQENGRSYVKYRKAFSASGFWNATRGSTVALVGNASSIDRTYHGQNIDGHHIVVRMNNWAGYMKSRQDEFKQLGRGHRCTFWFHGPDMVPRWFRHFVAYANGSLKKEYPEAGKATTGFALICLLRYFCRPREVGLFGFDWFRSPSIGKNTVEYASHTPYLEEKYVKEKMGFGRHPSLKIYEGHRS